MANDEIISFDENVARDLIRMRQEWRSGALTRANRRRRTPIMDATGSGAMLVGFTIVDASDCGLCTATAEVAINFGTTPELDSYDQFTVYDFGGCALNEPIDSLVGRYGVAVYGTRVGNGACPGLPETGWWIISLCGYEDVCA